MSQTHEASPERPYDLQNVRLERNGTVRELPKPNETNLLAEGKPYKRWNMSLINRRWNDDRYIVSMVEHNATVYASTVKWEGDHWTDPATYVLPSDYDHDTKSGAETEPALVISNSRNLTERGQEDSENGATGDTTYVGYCIIPFSKRGEAGAWYFFGAETTLFRDSADDPWFGKPLEVELEVNSQCAYVEVYRTVNFNNRGFTSTIGFNLSSGQMMDTDDTLYFLTRVETQPRIDGGLTYKVKWLDTNTWISDRMWAYLVSEEVFTEDALPIPMRSGNEYQEAQIDIPRLVLDHPRNFHGQASDTNYGIGPLTYKGFAGFEMYNHGGTVLYGNVMWPTREPAIIMASGTTGSGVIEVQCEYKVGETQYRGPKLLVGLVQRVRVLWNGEAALLVYRDGILLERMTSSPTGSYVSSRSIEVGGLPSDQKTHLTFAYDLDDSSLPSAQVVDEVNYVQEENVCLLARVNRPHEVTFDQFYTENNSRITGLYPTTLDEAESLRAYDFLVMTETTVAAFIRNDRDVIQQHVVTGSVGKRPQFIDPSLITNGVYATSWAVPTKYGLVMVGEDDRVVLIEGRRSQRLDIDHGDTFVSLSLFANPKIVDLAYNPWTDELYVATSTAIYLYSFIDRGWMAKYELPLTGPEGYEYTSILDIWFDRAKRCVVGRAEKSIIEGAVEGTVTLVFEEPGTIFVSGLQHGITTQRITNGVDRLKLGPVVVEYDKAGYAAGDPETYARIEQATQHPKVAQVGEAATTGQVKIDVAAPRGRILRLPLVGRGHQLKISGFERLYEIAVQGEPTQNEGV